MQSTAFCRKTIFHVGPGPNSSDQTAEITRKGSHTPEAEQLAPEKWMVGRPSFPIHKGTFQGRTVSFREGKLGNVSGNALNSATPLILGE